MALPIEVAALVLLAALLHAAWNALLKAGQDRLVVLTIANGSRVLIALLIAPFIALPQADSWPFLLASVILHTGYYFFLVPRLSRRRYQSRVSDRARPVADPRGDPGRGFRQ